MSASNKPQSRAAELCRKVWLTAMQAPGPVEIPFPTRSDAMRFRFGLYDAAKRARAVPDRDPQLLAAVNECSIAIRGNVLCVQRSEFSTTFKAASAALEQLGQTVPTATSEEREAAESLARVQALLSESN